MVLIFLSILDSLEGRIPTSLANLFGIVMKTSKCVLDAWKALMKSTR